MQMPLSRMPLPSQPIMTQLSTHLAEFLVTTDNIKEWTQKEKKIIKVLQHIQQGWMTAGDSDLEPYSSCRLRSLAMRGVYSGGHVQ